MKTKVKEISHKGTSSVIEWVDEDGDTQRSILPSTELIETDNELYVEDPEQGAIYGAAWEDYIHTKVGPKGIAALLRANGIWTFEDYFNNTAVVNYVFREAASQNLQQFNEAVRTRRE